MTPEEIEQLRAENQALKHELAELRALLAGARLSDSPQNIAASDPGSALQPPRAALLRQRRRSRLPVQRQIPAGRAYRIRPRGGIRRLYQDAVIAQPAETSRPTPAARHTLSLATRLGSIAWRTWLALGAILVLAAYLRGIGLLSWDESFRLHPDERFYGDVASAVRLPASMGDYFDSAVSPLNPRNVGRTFFVYGLLPITITRLTAERLGLNDYYAIYKVGRVLATLFDLGSVVLVFLIGARMLNRRVGLLAALLAALTVLAIQQAHFYTVDAFVGFFTLLGLYWALRISQGGGWGCYVLFGLSVGLAMAGGRLTLATLGLVGAVAALQWSFVPQAARALPQLSAAGRSPQPKPATRRQGAVRFLWVALPRLAVAGLLTLLAFRILQPDAFIGSRPGSPPIPGAQLPWLHGLGFFDMRLDPRYIANLREIRGLIDGTIDVPPSLQWVGRTRYLFPLQNMIMWGMGLPLGLLAVGAWAAVGWRMLRRRWGAPLVLWVWVTGYFAWQGGQFVIAMRYLLPIYGPLIIFGAWLLVALLEWTGAQQGRIHLSISDSSDSNGQAHGREEATPAPRRFRISTLKTNWMSLGAWGLAAVIVAGTLAWAYAFTRIYARPHSRITASRWLFDHAPPGSAITAEDWDDALPLHVDGRNPWAIFKGIKTTPFAEDDRSKYTGVVDTAKNNRSQPGLLDQLDQADFVVLSSNRVYDSIARMPMRYPALIRYYHYLFSGELGFELTADITSYPTLFGIAIPDQSAEESFSVYDHPRVLIFRKTAAFSRGHAERLLTGDINWSEVYKIPSVWGDRAPTALRFTPEQWQAYQSNGTWAALFAPDTLAQQAPVAVWLLVVELLGLAGFVLVSSILPALPDRGWSVAKTVTLLLVSYAAWLLGSIDLIAFSAGSVWLCVGLLIVGAAFVGWRRRAELHAIWRERRTAILVAEGLFLGAFFALLVVRYLNPDLWHPDRGGEKPMDLAYLTATIKSAAFPPYDPWFAGGAMNYYYFGFVIVGALVHMTGIVPAVAYNLAVPTLFALTAIGVWGVVYNLLAPKTDQQTSTHADEQTGQQTISFALHVPVSLSRSRLERRALLSGLLAVLLVLLVGNLAQALWFLPGSADRATSASLTQPLVSYAQQQDARGRTEWAYWDATRLVEGTVNEFPFFTFLFADLHPHLIAMPFSLATLALTVALARARQRGRIWPSSLLLGLLALLIGALRAINTWDYATFTGLVLATFALTTWERTRRSGGDATRIVAAGAAQAAAVVAFGGVLFLPFTQHFATTSSGLILWSGTHTSLWDWLRINGLWLFVLASAAGLLARQHLKLAPRTLVIFYIALVAVVAVGSYMQMGALALLLPLMLCAALIVLGARAIPARRLLPLLWASAGLALSIAVELVVVKGDVGRMNTVFKFGLHTWILFALAAAVALPAVWDASRRRSRGLGTAWGVAAALLICAALVYPLTATRARIVDRASPRLAYTLDGMAYMRDAEANEQGQPIALKPDADAISWIQQHIAGSPVILEAHQPSYRWGGRVAIYSGLPTLLGWEWHQIQQRTVVNAKPIVEARAAAIDQIYRSSDLALTRDLLHDYGVDYIYVGGLERVIYAPLNAAKFEQLVRQGVLERVYDQESTQIYRVVDPMSVGILTTDLPIVKPAAGNMQMAAEGGAGAATPQPVARPADQPALVQAPASTAVPTPIDVASIIAQAQAARQAGRLDDAINMLTGATRAAPRDVALWRMLGDALGEAKRYDAADAAYIHVIVIAPSADNFTAFGAAQVAWARYDAAERTLKQALVVDAKATGPYYWLGVLFAKKGNQAEARKNLERYVQLEPAGQWSADATKLLKTLP